MSRTQPTLLDGWRSCPDWVKISLGLFILLEMAVATWVLHFLMGMQPGVTLALIWGLRIVLLVALVGTVTDAFAAPEDERPGKMRSLAIGGGLILLVSLFYSGTLVKIGTSIATKAGG